MYHCIDFTLNLIKSKNKYDCFDEVMPILKFSLISLSVVFIYNLYKQFCTSEIKKYYNLIPVFWLHNEFTACTHKFNELFCTHTKTGLSFSI